MQNVKFLARLFLKLQENGPLLSARPRIFTVKPRNLSPNITAILIPIDKRNEKIFKTGK